MFTGRWRNPGFYGIVAIAWVGSLVADLVINKPLGLSPAHIEFKRAHLYDINPVGVGAHADGLCSRNHLPHRHTGRLSGGSVPFIAMGVALIMAPLIAWKTGGRFYTARPFVPIATDHQLVQCTICEHHFEPEDLTHCPAYDGNHLFTVLFTRCPLRRRLQTGGRISEQLNQFLGSLMPKPVLAGLRSRLGHFLSLLVLINGLSGLLLS